MYRLQMQEEGEVVLVEEEVKELEVMGLLVR